MEQCLLLKEQLPDSLRLPIERRRLFQPLGYYVFTVLHFSHTPVFSCLRQRHMRLIR